MNLLKQQLDSVIETLQQSQGLDISGYDPDFLAKSLGRRLAANANQSIPAYRRRLAEDRAEAAAFVYSLNINYSEFFRNSLNFALLEQLVLPALVEAKRGPRPAELRIWSAGCAAGQEVYSVLMLLEDLTVARGQAVPARIFATDLDAHALAAARQGVFDAAAVRNVRQRHLQDYFSVKGGSYAVAARLREQVDFSLYDLRDESSACPPACLYGDFDLILCCNLMFYYRADYRRRLLDKFHRVLSPGGYLVTGEAERDWVGKHGELRAVIPAAALFQKAKLTRR